MVTFVNIPSQMIADKKRRRTAVFSLRPINKINDVFLFDSHDHSSKAKIVYIISSKNNIINCLKLAGTIVKYICIILNDIK